MKNILNYKWVWVLCLGLALSACSQTEKPQISPLHLDDIHFIVESESEAVAYFEDKFGAREMAHPGERFELVRFLSVKWQDPTITITRIGPYEDLPADRNKRWLDAVLVRPDTGKENPFYGVKWLALAVPSLSKAKENLLTAGAKLFEDQVVLPMDPAAKAFSVYGPDGAEIVIVERKEMDFDDAEFAIDHIQFLTANAQDMAAFFAGVFDGITETETVGSVRLKVADAVLIASEPEVFNYQREDVSPSSREGVIQLGIGHLGFLYEDIQAAVDQAADRGYTPIFAPTPYIYKNKPTLYTFTAFKTPDNFNIEMVQIKGRVGPHSYYD